eukprot:ANDGO_04221.mRNA.1 Inositol hexakisphosphate and diphosphoinositol-pentakisphosphate kinase
MALNDTIKIGLCVVDRKAQSKSMKELMRALCAKGCYECIPFGDDTIFGKEPENWPACDVLVSFYADSFPLEKVRRYVRLFNPIQINDVDQQHKLLHRASIYENLEQYGVPVPPHKVIDWNCSAPDTSLPFQRPFVEKPVDAEDHRIHVYYPDAGIRRLFRKTGDASSSYDPSVCDVRRDAAYMYEPFMEADRFRDIKVYMVGPDYLFAEARKSPTKDGQVERDAFGKEIRVVVELSEEEKQLGKLVFQAFGQFVCGFDILRSHGMSYVMDVNGWSFVKNAPEYVCQFADHVHAYICENLKRRAASRA